MHLSAQRETTGYRGYSLLQSTRPQTIGYALSDSPVAQASWIYEKFQAWTHHPSTLSKDEMLDTITLYWLSNSGASSARFYWENKPDTTAWPIGEGVAVGLSWFPGDTSFAPREWCERYWGRIVYWNEQIERGGHFAAWEVPGIFVREVREWRRRI